MKSMGSVGRNALHGVCCMERVECRHQCRVDSIDVRSMEHLTGTTLRLS